MLNKARIKRSGAASTFIGLQVNLNQKEISYIQCGDSFIFHVRDYKILKRCEGNNSFISTHKNIDKNDILSGSIPFETGDKFILATDGIGEYINKLESLEDFFALKNFEEFKSLIHSGWNDSKIKVDDITLVIIEPEFKDCEEYLPGPNYKNWKPITNKPIWKPALGQKINSIEIKQTKPPTERWKSMILGVKELSPPQFTIYELDK